MRDTDGCGGRPGDEGGSTACRALRKDAERNRVRVIEAAAAAFARDGLDASLEEIARQAGVGIATLYRRFPNRQALIEAVFVEPLNDDIAAVEEALEHDDPWAGFAGYLQQLCERASTDRGFNQITAACLRDTPAVTAARTRRDILVGKLVARAQDAGVLRPDIVAEDLFLLVWGHSAVVAATRDIAPDAWRRYLSLTLDGLRATTAHPLPQPPLSEPEVQAAQETMGKSCSGGC